MTRITIKRQTLEKAAAEGMDAFLQAVEDAILQAIGGELNADNMGGLNGDQVTLLAYCLLREEVMDGGFVQLIHNGYGPFFFHNPFAKAMRAWDIKELAKIVNKARDLFYRLSAEDQERLTRETSDEEFMALFEQFPEFDDLDDSFVEQEEDFTAAVCRYVDENLDQFALVCND